MELATQYGRYGYRRGDALLREEGFLVNHKRVERLWLNVGSCVRIRPAFPDHVWSYDFVFARTSDGRPLRLLTMLDEFTRECLAIDVVRHITSDDVLGTLTRLFVQRGAPRYVRSDNGPEFTARAVRAWPLR